MPEAGGGGDGWVEVGDWLIRPSTYNWPLTFTTSSATTGTFSPWLTTTNTTGGTGGWYYPTWEGHRLVGIEYTADEGIQRVEETPEQIAAAAAEIERVAAEVAAQRELRAQERVLATARGEELLLSMLDENQREALRQDSMFAVIGSHGTVYRIRWGTSGNVDWIKPDGSVGGRLCAHPSMRESWLPTADVMLAQVLALRTDEREFCRVANVHVGRRPPVMEMVAA